MYDDLIAVSAALYNVPPDWIQGFISIESNWNPNAYRAEPQINDASYGLMQLLYSTAQGLGYSGDASGLYDPATNIDLGTKLIAQLIGQHGMNPQAVASAYNSGSATAYQTNSGVANYVNKFAAAVQSFASATVNVITDNPGSGTIIVLALLAFLFLKGR